MNSVNYNISIENHDAKVKDGIQVVIDVLRASSTIVTALANGVEEIIPVNTEEKAFELKKQGYTLAGESQGVKLPDFDIGNSPVELLEFMKKSDVKKIVLKTTNATKVLAKVETALICSSLNLSAIKTELNGVSANIIVVGSRKGMTDDLGVAMALYSSLNDEMEVNKEYLKECIIESNSAKHLTKIGYKNDIEFISQIDRYHVVPILKEGVIVNKI